MVIDHKYKKIMTVSNLKYSGVNVAKWIKAMDCEFIMRGFNSRHSPGAPSNK